MAGPARTNGAAIGVAMSGGGVRAAFFSLGAMLYLVRSGLHRDVRLVSSVSGGSIVNAVVAAAGDFSESEPLEFGRLAARTSSQMARKGVFFWPGLRSIVRTMAICTLWAPLYMVLMLAVGAFDEWEWRIFWFGEIGYTGLMTLYLLTYTWFGRQKVQQAAYQKFLDHVSQADGASPPSANPRLGDLPESTVTHVLCATELTSGQPFYMSQTMVLSPLYGRGKPDVPLAKAIYASAAFPIGFPPLRLAAHTLGLTGGRDDQPPRQLLLSDGGVFNNLGTEAFSANDSTAQIFLPDPSLPIIPIVARQLVVNASAPPKRIDLSTTPVVRTIVLVRRIMSVMYENTVRPRVQQLMDQVEPGGPIVVDISESPIELVDRLVRGRPDGDPIRDRAEQMRATLTLSMSESEWKDYSDRAAATRTVLNAVGKTAAVRLVRLGYLDTAIACHAYLETAGIAAVPGDDWFRDLVDGTISDERLTSPSEPAPAV